jgi:hypothetical protein
VRDRLAALIKALHCGALAWIEGREIPDVEGLNLPLSTMGTLVRKAYVEQTSLGFYFFEDSGPFPGVKHRNINSLRATFTGSTKIMARVGQVGHWRGCSICLIWMGVRNADEHGADLVTQRLIRLANCERAIRRLYRTGELLPPHERHPFREAVLSKSLCNQQRWFTLTEEYLPGVTKRVKDQQEMGQRSLTVYYGWSRTPRFVQLDGRNSSLPTYSFHQPGD